MVHEVDTGASVLAWLILTLIYFILAIDALILGHTDRSKQKGRNTGPLLETDHQSK